MTIDFRPSTPIESKPGRVSEPNPYVDAVKSIANKKGDNDKPAALEFTDTHAKMAGDSDDYKKYTGRLQRRLREAGEGIVPAVSVRSTVKPYVNVKNAGKSNETRETNDTRSLVVFWTVPFVPRKTKDKTADAPAAVENSDTAPSA
jgi:hypothetical protein